MSRKAWEAEIAAGAIIRRLGEALSKEADVSLEPTPGTQATREQVLQAQMKLRATGELG